MDEDHTAVVDLFFHPLHGIGDNFIFRYGDVGHFVLDVCDIVIVVERHVIFSFGADVDHGRDLVVEDELVIARIRGRAAEPEGRRDLVEPTVAHDRFIEVTYHGEEVVEDAVEDIHCSEG